MLDVQDGIYLADKIDRPFDWLDFAILRMLGIYLFLGNIPRKKALDLTLHDSELTIGALAERAIRQVFVRARLILR